MSAPAAKPTPDEWVDLILNRADLTETWTAVFARLRDIALANPGAATLHRETIVPDRLLAEAAWDLWEGFSRYAPTVIDELKRFWVAASGTGTAILVLDGLSLRELPAIVRAGSERGIEPTRVEVRGSEVPSQTDRFAEALGLPGRSTLYNNQAPASFVFAGLDVRTDLLDAPFVDCVGSVPSIPRVFLWHKWPDEPLIHLHEDRKGGPAVVAKEAEKQLRDDGFWAFVERLRQGRKLIITGDHGYADANSFSSEVKDGDSVKLLRTTFGARRCVREKPESPWPSRHLPPLVCRHNG